MNLFEFEFYDESKKDEARAHITAFNLYEALNYFYSHFPGVEPDRVISLGEVITGVKEKSE